MRPITILLADQHVVVRAGLRCIFERAILRVLGEADNGREAVRLCKTLKPDVLVSDIPMPRLNGLEAARQIQAAKSPTRILILTAVQDPDRIDEAVRSGVSGFILKSTPVNDLLAAVRAIHAGKNYYSPPVARHIQQRDPQELTRHARPAHLTQREVEVVQLMAESFQYKSIAAELGVATRTIERHRENIEKKLGVQGIAGIVAFALRTGISEGK